MPDRGLAFTVSCGHCGTDLSLVNQAHRPAEVVAMLECSNGACRRAWSVQVRLCAELRPESVRRARDRARVMA